MPYLAAAAEEATGGVPMMRPMVLEFPDDVGARDVDLQYMLGPSLLVSPVFTASGLADTYLPAGAGRTCSTAPSREAAGSRAATGSTRSGSTSARAPCCPSAPSTTLPSTPGPMASRCGCSSFPTATTR
ncbi:hypothetical protein [Tessaracoccus coleopterorum]|uniref:hypothetical protein n=1 Tax=Tessaracoccus coleopterorum TaxID=2714950 RepID=UPI0038CD959D